MSKYDVIPAGEGRFIKAWRQGVVFEDAAIEQLKNTAKMPFVFKWVAAMPDTHFGMGSTVGTVVPTLDAVMPAAVGVDIGCGMMAIRTKATVEEFKSGDLKQVRALIETAVPHGRSHDGKEGDCGSWKEIPALVQETWNREFADEYAEIIAKHPRAKAFNTVNQLGTLGTGNHFIELCGDEDGMVWIVLHSGSRGLGNKIGMYFTDLALEKCLQWFVPLPDQDLAFLPRGDEAFDDYIKAVSFAQRFAWKNREIMMTHIRAALFMPVANTMYDDMVVHCHHNYVAIENHFGKNVYVTRKGAVRARLGDLGIIPGSMGARTYIVRGLGSVDSFCTCSHGAGRSMGRREAVRRFSVEDHVKATEGVECLKDASVLDETPMAYKNIDDVMAAQTDLVEPIHRLKQFVCVKGGKDGKW